MKTIDLLLAAWKGVSHWQAIRAYFPQASNYQVFQATVQKMEEQPDTRALVDQLKVHTEAFEQRVKQNIETKKKSQ